MISQLYSLQTLHARMPALTKAATVISSSICDIAVTILGKMDMRTSSSAMKRLSEVMREHNRLSKESYIERLHILSQRVQL